MSDEGAAAIDELRRAGVERRDLVALTLKPGVGLAMAVGARKASLSLPLDDPAALVAQVEEALRPRWVVWSSETTATLVAAGARVATCWDIAAVHRLLFGGGRADPAWVWARLHGLAPDTRPATAASTLFDAATSCGDLEDPVGPDGHLRPEWVIGGWCATIERLARWAELASTVGELQVGLLGSRGRGPRSITALSESAAELLCAEMTVLTSTIVNSQGRWASWAA